MSNLKLLTNDKVCMHFKRSRSDASESVRCSRSLEDGASFFSATDSIRKELCDALANDLDNCDPPNEMTCESYFLQSVLLSDRKSSYRG